MKRHLQKDGEHGGVITQTISLVLVISQPCATHMA